MKKFLLIILCCLTSLGYAQDSYRKALNAYLQSNNTDLGSQAQKILPFLQRSMGDTVANVFVEYMQAQMYSDIADSYEPIFRKYVSESELNELSKWNKRERTKQIQQKSLDLVTSLNNENKLFEKMQPYMVGLTALMHGEQPDSIPAKQLSPTYKQQLQTFMDANHLGEIFDNITQTLVSQTSSIINNEQTKQDVYNYTIAFIDNMIIDIFSEIFSEDDLKYVNKQAKTPAAQHAAEAQAEMMKDPIAYSQNYYDNIIKWVENNHPEYTQQFKTAFKIN